MPKQSPFKVPTRRAVASLAVLSVLSAIEKQRQQNRKPEEDFAYQDMSGELQTIPARHGVATFVPRGRTIKIINTYGRQVVSTWAFSLHAPPDERDNEETQQVEAEIDEKTLQLKEEIEKTEASDEVEKEKEGKSDKGNLNADGSKQEESPDDGTGAKKHTQTKSEESSNQTEVDDPPEQAPDTPENAKTAGTPQDKKAGKRTWSSYLPSIPYRSKGTPTAQAQPNPDPETEKAKNEAASKKWSSYLPTGKSFSSYVPNVQLPDSKGVVSAFQASHYRDPNKSYAEQLYDFSKTPVGAGSIAAATGSGTASSLYAAYNAYTKLSPARSNLPPMEYLSLPHTRASTHTLVPEVGDTLLTNLRKPIMTLIEDTTGGAHDTLTAACDVYQYAALGVDVPEEHGSCAENLVLALKELNEKAGLKGAKAVGADITVNIAPTPLHLFMNAPIEIDTSVSNNGAGARGAKLTIQEPQSKKRSFVRFKAERDIVIVMSACPMEIGQQNGGRVMACNFVVEETTEQKTSSSTSTSAAASTKPQPSKSDSTVKRKPVNDSAKQKVEQQRQERTKPEPEKEQPSKRDSKTEPLNPPPPNPEATAEKDTSPSTQHTAPQPQPNEVPKPKKKPKKLERRSTPVVP